MTDKTVPFPQTELKLLISKCVHCGEPLWDNGTVAVHLKLIICEGKPTVLQTQWCDTTNHVICPNCGINTQEIRPLQNLSLHWTGGCKNPEPLVPVIGQKIGFWQRVKWLRKRKP